jgi:ribosomal protein S18 acetylase RimI-like enzyme
MNWTIEPLPTHGPLFEGAMRVYGDAFAEPPYSDPDRGAEIRSRMQDFHGRREGFAALVALDEQRNAVGMTYGYRGASGQWWHDTVVNHLARDTAQRWLSDSYELVEVAVSPVCQARGIGAALIDALLADRTEATCVLSTRVDSRAHVLYRRLGFEEIVEMAFAARGARFYIMGKRLR